MDAGGFDTLSADANTAIHNATVIMGPERHISMLPDLPAKIVAWPVPFSDGIEKLGRFRGQPTVILTSGDPFWYGAGSVITKNFETSEWVAIPAQSSFSLAANRLGWSIEKTKILGLHAAPFSRLRPFLHAGTRILATVRDGDAVHALAAYLCKAGFGKTGLSILEALGGTDETCTRINADSLGATKIQHPVMVGLDISGSGQQMSLASGRADDWFEHDGQITKQPVRALTLSALAPTPGAYLWDLGAGSGSIAIEWLLSGPDMKATAVEKHAERAQRIRQNAANLGVDWLEVVEDTSLNSIESLPTPDVVFIGGGLKRDLLDALWNLLPAGTKIVANGVTLETDALLIAAQAEFGGDLMRIELSNMSSIGTLRGWKAAYPITQWIVRR